MKIRKIVGMVLSGIGAIAGVQSLVGCSDDTDSKPVVKLTQEQIQACCGNDDGSSKYENCIKDYQTNGVCARHIDPGPITYYGPDPVMPKPDKGLTKCCGEDDGSERFKFCANAYRENGSCDIPSIYGPAPVDPPDADIADCCGDKSDPGYQECADKFINYCADKQFYGSMSVDECAREYKIANECNVIKPVYGIPVDVSEEDIENCCEAAADFNNCAQKFRNTCGGFMSSSDRDVCVEDYKKSDNCFEENIKPEYGMLPVDECCGKYDGSSDYTECVEAYNRLGFCSFELPEPVYGPEPKELTKGQIDLCCGDKSGADYDKCAKDFNDYCSDMQINESMSVEECVDEYAAANKCDIVMADYGMPSITEKDIEKCCGKDKESDDYKACVAEYLRTNKCPNMSSTVYGMPPLPDA